MRFDISIIRYCTCLALGVSFLYTLGVISLEFFWDLLRMSYAKFLFIFVFSYIISFFYLFLKRSRCYLVVSSGSICVSDPLGSAELDILDCNILDLYLFGLLFISENTTRVIYFACKRDDKYSIKELIKKNSTRAKK